MITYSAYVADGLRFSVTLQPEAGKTLPDMTGGAAQVTAENRGTIVAGSAAIEGADRVACTFPAGALAAGVWEIRLRVDPAGPQHGMQTLDPFRVHMQ